MTFDLFSLLGRTAPLQLVELFQPDEFFERTLRVALMGSFEDFRLDRRRGFIIFVFFKDLRLDLTQGGLIETVLLVHFVDFWVNVGLPLFGRGDEGSIFRSVLRVSEVARAPNGLVMRVVARS